MSVVILDVTTVQGFVEDANAFNKCVDEKFHELDVNGDGVLCRSDPQKGINNLLTLGSQSGAEEQISIQDIFFEKFDSNHNGNIDREEFRSEIKEIMLAIARGIGNSPVSVALYGDSLLTRAVEHELTKGDKLSTLSRNN